MSINHINNSNQTISTTINNKFTNSDDNDESDDDDDDNDDEARHCDESTVHYALLLRATNITKQQTNSQTNAQGASIKSKDM